MWQNEIIFTTAATDALSLFFYHLEQESQTSHIGGG